MTSNFGSDEEGNDIPIRRPPPHQGRIMHQLPNVIYMPHSFLNFEKHPELTTTNVQRIVDRMSEKGMLLTPSWEEGQRFMMKADLTRMLQDRLPAPLPQDDLPVVCVIPTRVVYPTDSVHLQSVLPQVSVSLFPNVRHVALCYVTVLYSMLSTYVVNVFNDAGD
jgi:hypothetical protein